MSVQLDAGPDRRPPAAAPPAGLGPWSQGLAVLPVALLATATLWWPDHGDQTLFRITAARMNHGLVYYRDFWDIKQPGIYWFHQLGDRLIPGGLGARVLELALAVVSAFLVTRITAGWSLRRSVRLAGPTLVLGPYLIWSYTAGIGQIEGLMNVLLLTALVATWPAAGRARPGPAWFGAGLVVGAIVLLKTLYAPIPLVLLAGAAVATLRSDRRRTLTGVGLAGLGAVLPVALALYWCQRHGVLDLALRTTFELPSQVARSPETHAPDSRRELEQVIKNMFPVIGPLAVVGLVTARRTAHAWLSLTLTATAATAFLLTLPQLWTTYRWLLLAAPVGLLAVDGLEVVLGWFQARRAAPGSWPARGTLLLRVVAAGAAAALTVPMLSQPIDLVRHARERPWGLDQKARIGRGIDGDLIAAEVAPMVGRVTPGEPIYVMGNPGLMALLKADQGAELAGWSMSMMPAVVWDELARELDRSRPALIFVDGRDWGPSRTGPGRAVFAMIAQQYRPTAVTPDGTWYQIVDPARPAPGLDGNHLFR